jgi:hypothetical protein
MKSSFLVLQGIVGVKCMFGETIPFVRRKCVTYLIESNLADAIWACGSDCTHEIDGEGFQYVLGGGSLPQRIPWTHGDSFVPIAQMYVDHVIKKYKDPS